MRRRVALAQAGLLVASIVFAVLGDPVLTARPARAVTLPTNACLAGTWISPLGLAYVKEGADCDQNNSSRLIALRPNGSSAIRLVLPGDVIDVTFDAAGYAYALAASDQGTTIYKVSPSGALARQANLAKDYPSPENIEYGAD